MSIVAWVLTYVQSLPPPETPASSPTEKQDGSEEPQEEVISLLIAGYSYGSLIASRLPSTNKHILPLMNLPPSDRPAFANAIDAARRSARRWRDSHSSTRTSYSGSSVNRADVLKAVQDKDSSSPVKEHWEDRAIKWRVISKYLLISPLLPPVSSFLIGFGQGGKNSLTGWTKGLVGMGGQGLDGVVEEGRKGIDELGTKVLAIYGDGDTFTSVKKYRKWKERMGGVSKSWKGVEIEGAGHFWHENGVIEELEEAVMSWVG
jgi:pimeloyl-ACP methyl ester carboxylesterase